MTALKIACIGEAMIEMIVDADGKQAALGVAGDSMNTAVYLARCLGPEYHVAFASMIGTDPLSARIESFIASEGVSTEFLKKHPTLLPGLYTIETNASGERSFSYWRSASAARHMFSSDQGLSFDDLAGFDIIFMSAISLAILPQAVRDQFFSWLTTFRSRGGQFAFDSNYRPALWTDQEEAKREISRGWTHCDIALPSIDDEMALFGDACESDVLKRFKSYGVHTGALKRGAFGPISIGDNARDLHPYKPAVKIVDTTAAGDSFNGGFLAHYLQTKNLAEAMQSGHDLANIVIGYRGAIIPRSA